MALSSRDWSFLIASVALGAWTFFTTNQVTSQFFQPILLACQNPNISPQDFAASTGFHSYDPDVGLFGIFDMFVCLITQFFHDLVQHYPAGTVVGLGTFIGALPILVLMALEAGRQDARGLVRYPMIIALLAQLVGVSVIFPLVWIPSYILGAGRMGGITQRRVYLSMIPPVSYLTCAVLMMWMSPDKPLWTRLCGIFGGPAIVLSFLPLWFSGTSPDAKDGVAAKQSAEFSTMVYAGTGILSLFAWLWLLLIVMVPNMGLSPSAIYGAVWGEASASVKFMTIDMIVLWLSALLCIGYQKESAALEALILSFLFGPGAGIAMVMAGLQVEEEKSTLQAIQNEEGRPQLTTTNKGTKSE